MKRRADPSKLIELLFDEIEDLNALLDERTASEARMAALIERQQILLDRALSLAEKPAASGLDAERVAALQDRSQRLIEQTLGKIEARDAEFSRLTGLMDRALTTVAGLDAEVTRQAEVAVKQQALLERLFQLAEISLDRIGGARRRPRVVPAAARSHEQAAEPLERVAYEAGKSLQSSAVSALRYALTHDPPLSLMYTKWSLCEGIGAWRRRTI